MSREKPYSCNTNHVPQFAENEARCLSRRQVYRIRGVSTFALGLMGDLVWVPTAGEILLAAYKN